LNNQRRLCLKAKIFTTVIIFILTAIFIGIIYRISPDTLTDNIPLVYVFTGLFGAFLFSVLSNLVSFLLSYYTHHYEIDKKVNKTYTLIEDMRTHMKKESITLLFKDRKSHYNTDFYHDLFNNNSTIKVSGIRATQVIENILKEKKKRNNWVEQLKHREDVTVKVLTTSMNSDHVAPWEKREGVLADSYKNEIKANFEKLREFSTTCDSKLAKGSSISIRTINDIQYFKITYAGCPSTEEPDKLYLSISFNKDAGPLYQIHQSSKIDTYEECLKYFDRLYESGKDLFLWNENEIVFKEENM